LKEPLIQGWLERAGLVPCGGNHFANKTAIRLTRGLRIVTLVLMILGLTSQTGCQVFRGFGKKAVPAPVVLNGLPSQADLVARLNAHTSRVRQLQSNVSLELPGAPRLTGTLILERPNRLRLKAGVGGISEMGFDVGSNAELFWVWNKASLPGQPPPSIYYAKQIDYHRVQQLTSIPIDPQWIIDASGLVEFSPTDVHHGPYAEDGRLKLVTIHRTPDGHVTRVSTIDPRTALIVQQALYDGGNRLMGYTNSTSFEYFEQENISLPRRIEMHLIGPSGQDVKLAINASQYRINAFHGNAEQTWSMPNPDGVPLINLAEVNPAALPQ
jgi:hypothetical protein